MTGDTRLLRNVRVPALRPPAAQAAAIRSSDPSSALAAHFATVANERMAGLPFLNPALNVEVAVCRQVAGDWLAVVITPWSILLTLVFGGGELWRDAGLGERVRCRLPVGDIDFIADVGDCGLGPYLYCPLIAPANLIESQKHARDISHEAIETCLNQGRPSHLNDVSQGVPERAQPPVTRRAFLLGKRT